MNVFIVEENRRSLTAANSPAKPINLYAENRSDILVLFLRVIRYLYQNGVAGENLTWSGDDAKTKIWIENLSPELLNDDNKRPALFIDVGQVVYSEDATNMNLSQSHGGNGTKYSHHNLGISITAIGRNKLETHKIAERTAAALFLLKYEILEHTKNLETIGPITVSRISPARGGPGTIAGDTTLAFTASISFPVSYYLEFPFMHVGDLFTSSNFTVKSESKDGSATSEVSSNSINIDMITKK